jgi:non-ribosomal peptide synthetase component F
VTTTVDQVGLRPADQEYWQAVIGGYAPLAVPQAWGRTDPGAEPGSALVRFGDLRDGLRTLAERSGASLGTVLLAAHLKVMSALTTERHFHCGVVAPAAPYIPADERTVGLPANTRLLPYTADTAATWRELVEQTRAAQAELWEHRCALAEIAAAAGDQRLIEVVFEHLGSAELDDASPAGHPATENAPNDFALKVTAVTGGASLISLSGAVRPDEAERLAGMYRRVLTAMAADSDGRARDGVLSAEKTAELTRRWNPPLPAWQPERCVHEAFEAISV